MDNADEQIATLKSIIKGYGLNAHKITECVREAKIADLQAKLEQTEKDKVELVAMLSSIYHGTKPWNMYDVKQMIAKYEVKK